jgi:head-tail adaptor
MTIAQPPKQKPMQPSVPPFQAFDERISFISRSETSDGYGGIAAPIDTTIADAWASIETPSSKPAAIGGETYTSSATEAYAYWKITTWYNSDVTLKHWIKHGTRMMNILNINNVENKNLFMILFCVEQVEPAR